MKKIKAILSDVDGTLADYDSNILPGVKPAIKKLQDKGVRFSLATGRAYYSNVKKIESYLNIKGIHILQGGAMIFDSLNDKILLQETISSESVKKIIQYLISKHLMFSIEALNNVYISKIFKENNFYAEAKNEPIEKFKFDKKVFKMVIYARVNKLTEEQISAHKKNLQKIIADISIQFFAHDGFFGADITSEKATKHTGVLEYLKFLNLSPDEVVAIGDGYNDYPLFTASGFGIAMANAPKELKEISKLIVPEVNEGGMIEALDYIYKNLI